MKCRNCRFYTGIKCHGHGDFWAECDLLKFFIERNNISYTKYDVWSFIVDEDDNCKLTDVLKLKGGKN